MSHPEQCLFGGQLAHASKHPVPIREKQRWILLTVAYLDTTTDLIDKAIPMPLGRSSQGRQEIWASLASRPSRRAHSSLWQA